MTKRKEITADIHITIPAYLMDRIFERVERGEYKTKSTFVADAVRRYDHELRDRELREKEKENDTK